MRWFIVLKYDSYEQSSNVFIDLYILTA